MHSDAKLDKDIAHYQDVIKLLNTATEIPQEKKSKSLSPTTSPTVYSEDQAATIIQTAWQRSRIAKAFFKDGYKTYLKLKFSEPDMLQLGKLMFGRTIAAFKDNSFFPIKNPYEHKDGHYHRNDNFNGPFFEEILKDFVVPDHENFIYVPFTILKSITIDDLLAAYLPNHRDKIEIITHDDAKLGILKIKKVKGVMQIKELLEATGIISSPWTLSLHALTLREKKTTDKKEVQTSSSSSTKTIDDSPSDYKELMCSPLVKKLKKLAADQNSSIYLLSNCLLGLLSGLEKLSIDQSTLERIYFFLNLGINFHTKNYERYAITVYGIIHEISLILFDNLKKNKFSFTYQDFKQEVIDQAIKNFGIQDEKKFHVIASPATSGSNAYTIAMKLAKSYFSNPDNIYIKKIGASYYEFELFPDSRERNIEVATYSTQSDFQEDYDDSDDRDNYYQPKPNIFLISAGPISSRNGIAPGTDINILIKNLIKNKVTHCIILIDGTTALYKNLKLTNISQSYLATFKIFIIVHESHQKFGLIHSDQAQYGRVFGICGKSFINPKLDQFEKNAEMDLFTHLDMLIGAYININCGKYLEMVKQQHFNNGAVLSHYFTSKILPYNEMLSNFKELYFTMFPPKKKSKNFNFLESRDSFGHFNTTNCEVTNIYVRITPNASDTIDMLILTCSSYFTEFYDSNQLLPLLNRVYYLENSEHWQANHSIGIIALLSTIHSELNIPKSVNDIFLLTFLLKISLNSLDPIFNHRDSQTRLYVYYRSLRETLLKKSDDKFKIGKNIIKFSETKHTADENLEFLESLSQYCQEIKSQNPSPSKLFEYAKNIILLDFRLKIKNTDPITCRAIVQLNKKNILTKQLLSEDIQDKDFCKSVFILSQNNLLCKRYISSILSEEKHSEIIKKGIIQLGERIKLSTQLIENLVDNKIKMADIPQEIAYLSLLSCEECKEFMQNSSSSALLQLHKYINNNFDTAKNHIPDHQLKTIMQHCDKIFCNTFVKTYKDTCKFRVFGNINRSQWGSDIFSGTQSLSIDKILKYAQSSKPNDSTNKSLEKMGISRTIFG